ncbi:hypothetical protein ACFFJT_19645 [Dyella flava]|uniref:Uncharacterized protein n=1 Tax=Dyella flava TaxID=1920170 RepID=A0ABS2JYI1_9GAMM|nr:hypothetical protein [Dyella flava]MBM7124052.1 hypothetical protein [Dyella flava]
MKTRDVWREGLHVFRRNDITFRFSKTGAGMQQSRSIDGRRRAFVLCFGRGVTLARFRWLLLILGLFATDSVGANASAGDALPLQIDESIDLAITVLPSPRSAQSLNVMHDLVMGFWRNGECG